MSKHRGGFDFILDAVSAEHDIKAYIKSRGNGLHPQQLNYGHPGLLWRTLGIHLNVNK